MAHKLLEEPVIETRKNKRFKLSWPKMEGKFGFSVFTGKKEVFVGVAVADVIREEVTKKRFIPASKGSVRTFRFDSVE